MKTDLQDIARNIGAKYGVSASELELPTTYPEGDLRKGIYSSYNTYVNEKARNQNLVGNMIDETMVPPKEFRFFYKRTSTQIAATLPPLPGEQGTKCDGVLQVWYGDWSFIGRVPFWQNPKVNPISINMYDIISRSDSAEAPQEIVGFLKNLDFFTPAVSRLYKNSHPRKL